MAIDPVTLSLILAGAQAAGSALSGASGARQTAADRQQQQRQFGATQGLNYQQLGQSDRQFAQNANMDRSRYLDDRAQAAATMQRRINLNPINDLAAYNMRGMLGSAPQPFQARDYTRGTMPGAGQAVGGPAPELARQAAIAQAYTPGAGGMDPSALLAARDRLMSMVGVPSEYTATAPSQMRFDAEIQQLMLEAASARTAQERLDIQRRIDALRAMASGANMPGTFDNVTVTQPNDVRQAEQDARDQRRRNTRNTIASILFGGGLGRLFR